MPYRIVERVFSSDDNSPTVLIANLHMKSDIEENLKKMEQVVEIAHEKEVNILIFPELCVTGYVWETENESEVRDYLRRGENSQIATWVKNIRDSLFDDGIGLEYVFYNNVNLKDDKFYNSTFILNPNIDLYDEKYIYNKIFLPPIEQKYFERGPDKRLTIDTKWGRFGFLICYDLNFVELARKYAVDDDVDAIITMAHWRSEARREYPEMNIKTDHYYGFLWNLMNSSKAAYNQVFSLAANAVGRHEISDVYFWGGSGIWAPSGMQLLQASNINEELLIIKNLDIRGQKFKEKDDFNYMIDFERFYNGIKDQGSYTKYL
ncbi:carbon-nitrogen hydrolase family protein [Natranaerobius thermophilus]|uniref:Nitrilase/cyanide hydratase and apolipoprotein N-acyltransferase n=1 Tax=Natranaerobius thermophilus (strain ATCC BAA-1301 / DSM 18059 / JW/NM-WN-LF) TaxID=457570 RepID=B2A5G7_NATTJ|nr:carbon-nitrogen hydrolase family protein [Natranaerobius thermophilus]ACB85322.1 Nitrilase/cyanide hydratase and apolipoprotein N-acyltransferase [Natranaerobius thermophilus JW/NM-WN-LF]